MGGRYNIYIISDYFYLIFKKKSRIFSRILPAGGNIYNGQKMGAAVP